MQTDLVAVASLLDKHREPRCGAGDQFAASITKAASKQTYYTISLLADRDRVADAFRAYAYFRWVDDQLDEALTDPFERIAFLERQRTLVNRFYSSDAAFDLLPHEDMLAALINSDHEEHSGLQAYIRNMMEVMSIDAHRRGRVMMQKELDDYSHHLAVGVTEALHYFIGHKDDTPRTDARYYAVTGAHIAHMLRDTLEDVDAGYFNIPCEFLKFNKLDPCDTQSMAFRLWVRSRVQLARSYFAAGKCYLTQVRSFRCRLAGCAYIARFESVLNQIEKDKFQLHPKTAKGSMVDVLSITGSTLSLYFATTRRGRQ